MSGTQNLDFPEMLGQMLYLDLFAEADVALLNRYRAGGVMVRRRFAKTTRQIVRLIGRHQETAGVPLFVGANFEWGTGNDTPAGTPFPGLMAIAANTRENAAVEYARTTAKEARALGVNHVIGPVLDVVHDPEGHEITTRSAGNDPRQAAQLGCAIIKVLQQNKVLCTAKHFPGAGDRKLSANPGVPVVTRDRKYFYDVALTPFKSAIRAGVGCVMVGNMQVPALSGMAELASLSERVVSGLLREELGHKGLVMTENLANGLTRLRPIDACAAAIRAGADLVLMKQEMLRPDNFADLVRTVEKDPDLVKKVAAASRRILEAKQKLGLFDGNNVASAETAEGIVGTAEHVRAAKRVALGAVTLLKNNGLVPARLKKNEKIVVITPRLPETALVPIKDHWGQLYRTVKEHHQQTIPAYVSFKPTPSEAEKTAHLAERAGLVIAIVTHEVGHEVDGTQATLANSVAKVNPSTIAVVLGNPFAARQLSDGIGAVLLTYSNMPVAQEAAAEVILGKAEAHGRLPVRI